MKTYDIVKRTVINTRGCVDDDSESREFVVDFFVVAEDERDDFGESVADDCGYQDYNREVHYKTIAVLPENELDLLMNELQSKYFSRVNKPVSESINEFAKQVSKQ